LPILEEMAAKRYPGLGVSQERPAGADAVATWVRMVDAATSPIPDPASSGILCHGLSGTAKKALSGARDVLLLEVTSPTARVRTALQDAARLLEYAARRGKAVVHDVSTGELFSSAQWRIRRVSGWLDGVPDARVEVAVRVAEHEGALRAVTQGMAKFGQPDVVVEAFAASHRDPVERLVALACQTLLEADGPWPTATIRVDMDRIEHVEFRNAVQGALGKNASRKALIQIDPATPRPKDPPGGLLAIGFAGAPGEALLARQDTLILHLFGEPREARGKATPREAERLASLAARARLFKEIKPRFRNGVPAGDTLKIKAPFRNDKGINEVMWVEVITWDVSRVQGTLLNAPRNIQRLREGGPVEVSDHDIIDYLWYRADGTVEGNTTEKARNNEKDGG
jgi:uncharacterized protein YegJ (DUF2314 family)